MKTFKEHNEIYHIVSLDGSVEKISLIKGINYKNQLIAKQSFTTFKNTIQEPFCTRDPGYNHEVLHYVVSLYIGTNITDYSLA